MAEALKDDKRPVVRALARWGLKMADELRDYKDRQEGIEPCEACGRRLRPDDESHLTADSCTLCARCWKEFIAQDQIDKAKTDALLEAGAAAGEGTV
jgi:hypothetical protein